MFFTNEEILCFLSLIKRGNLFGMKIVLPKKEKRAEYVKTAVEKMKTKGYVDRSGKLEKIMYMPIEFFREYSDAEEYILINHMRCAVLENNRLAVLAPKNDGAEIFYATKSELAVALLKGYPDLCNGKNAESVLTQLRQIKFADWENEFDENELQNILVVSLFKNRDIKKSKIYFWTKDKHGVYDFMKKESKNLSELDMRLNLMRLLKIVENKGD